MFYYVFSLAHLAESGNHGIPGLEVDVSHVLPAQVECVYDRFS